MSAAPSDPAASMRAPTPAATGPLDIVLVTGISGSGKSVAMQALEDAGFYCVDNLPIELLRDFIRLERERAAEGPPRRVAVSVDIRTGRQISQLLPRLDELRLDGVSIRSIFLDAGMDVLVRRYSETRRPHPLAREPRAEGDAQRALIETIEIERELLAGLREASTVIDTTHLRPAQLRSWVRKLVEADAAVLTLVFESFAFKRGVPLDADYVFDVRMLPNPHYVPELKPQTGRDAAVIDYLRQQPEAAELLVQIEAFLARWLPALRNDHRSYVTVAIGCTGGQHRSVYFAEQLGQRFAALATTLVRHRELDALPAPAPLSAPPAAST